MNNLEFSLKTRLKFGEKEALNVGKYLKDMKLNRIAVIVDSGVFNLDYIKEILKSIKKENFSELKIWEYSLKAEPDYDFLDETKLEFLDEKQKPTVDCFVGIGGGSVMDIAKGLATLTTNPGEARKYRGFPTDIIPSLPTITMPTTAGTGSEVTFNAVFVDLKEKKKLGINTTNNFPVLTILDPNLVSSCPKSVATFSGIDCLVHVLEAYSALGSNYLSRVFAKEGFKLVFNNLLQTLDNPKNLDGWANLQLGSYFGGLSLLGSGGGPTGALSYILGVHFNVPHGLAGAVFLPHIVEHNVRNGYDYEELYDTIAGADKFLDKADKNRLFSEKLFKLCKDLSVPLTLRGFGVDEKNIDILLKEIKNYGKAFSQNPAPFSVQKGEELINKLIQK